MKHVNIGLPAKADSLSGLNDIIDTLHNFFDMIQVFDILDWWLSLIDLIAAIRTLMVP